MTSREPVVNRTSSVYTLEVEVADRAEVNRVCDLLVNSCTAPLAASGVDHSRAFVRFRAGNDPTARRIALQTAGSLPYVLHTGYGVNVRIVEPNPTETEEPS